MKVFVTGYKGFVGRHLTQKLDDWVGYDGNILDLKKLTRAMRGCDAVIHLAGKFGKINTDLKIYKTNVIGTVMVVRAMFENGIKKIILASSIGANDRYMNSYDDSKWIAEKIVDDPRLDPVILRVSNIYGKDQEDKLVANVIRGVRGGEVNIYGTGHQTRDLIYIDDVVEAITLALNTKHREPIEVGSGESLSVMDVVGYVSVGLGVVPKINFLPYPKDYKEFIKSEVDLTDARKYLGYRPKWGFLSGIKKCLK